MEMYILMKNKKQSSALWDLPPTLQCLSFIIRCFLSLSKPGVAYLSDLMPDDLRWSRCNNRNTVHNKCSVIESFQNLPSPQSMEKLFSVKPVPGATKDRDC